MRDVRAGEMTHWLEVRYVRSKLTLSGAWGISIDRY